MSALGQKATFEQVQAISPLAPEADIAEIEEHVCLVPQPDQVHRSK